MNRRFGVLLLTFVGALLVMADSASAGRIMDRLFCRIRCRPRVCLDLHAPGGCETTGVYAWLPKPERTSPEHHARSAAWAAKLGAALGRQYAHREPFADVPRYASRWETPGFAAFCAELDCAGLCLETSYQAAGETVLTVAHYHEIGRRLAACLVAEAAESAGAK